MSLSKLCVVAGVGPGMGMAIARRFAATGHDLALIARRTDALDGYVAELAKSGARATPYPCDLADPKEIAAVFARIRAAQGDPEVLAHNASVWRETPTMSLSPELFANDLSLSVTGALAAAQAVHPAMKAAGRGSLLFTGGGLALRPDYGRRVASLTAGKSALRGLVHAIAGELAEDGIHVATITIAGTVAPGGRFDPDRIAEHFTRIHAEPPGAWTVEHIHQG